MGVLCYCMFRQEMWWIMRWKNNFGRKSPSPWLETMDKILAQQSQQPNIIDLCDTKFSPCTFFFHQSFSSLLLLLESVLVFFQRTQNIFFSFFFNTLQISFIHNCFLDCFPSIQIWLLKHLSWTLSRLRTRQNKFAPGNFILSTIFCGFHHHASRKIDALHVFWKEFG